MKVQTMNHYGKLAQDHWQKHLPARYKQLEAQEAYFRDLGQQVEERVEELMEPARSRMTTDYLDNLKELNTSKFEAEGQALRELALLEPVGVDAEA